MRAPNLFVLLLVPLFAACQGPAAADIRVAATALPTSPPAATDASLAELLTALHVPADRIHFVVAKGERLFKVMVPRPSGAPGDTLLKWYPCVLGESPVGDKFMQGDRRTPEGTFTFRSKRVHDRWHKFIWIDYPNAESWRRFKERQAMGLIPVGKDIGGEIGVHGVPEGMDGWIDQGADWTWGCIALRNADVDEIYPYVRPQHTLITIEP